jgi:hypothetical protein
LQRPGEGGQVDPQFIAHVRAKPVMRTELFRDFHCEFFIQAAFHIDQRKLL